MARLLRDHILTIDPGFGVDALALSADLTAPLGADQLSLAPGAPERAGETAALCDRLASRLGRPPARLAPRASHTPEHAQALQPAEAGAEIAWTLAPPPRPPRPSLLLPRPEPIAVLAEIPEGPPMRFTWRRAPRRTLRAEGPERIAPEWSAAPHEEPRVRDYYRVEDSEGRRYWLFREGLYAPRTEVEGVGDAPQWFVHGIFE